VKLSFEGPGGIVESKYDIVFGNHARLVKAPIKYRFVKVDVVGIIKATCEMFEHLPAMKRLVTSLAQMREEYESQIQDAKTQWEQASLAKNADPVPPPVSGESNLFGDESNGYKVYKAEYGGTSQGSLDTLKNTYSPDIFGPSYKNLDPKMAERYGIFENVDDKSDSPKELFGYKTLLSRTFWREYSSLSSDQQYQRDSALDREFQTLAGNPELAFTLLSREVDLESQMSKMRSKSYVTTCTDLQGVIDNQIVCMVPITIRDSAIQSYSIAIL
jgi:hypothetical protein